MNALHIRNEPMLWMPISAFSDLTMKGYGSAVNIDASQNQFFSHLHFMSPDDEAVQQGMSMAADRGGLEEIGIAIVTRDSHLQVLSETTPILVESRPTKFFSATKLKTEQIILPILWNARLVRDLNELVKELKKDIVYYEIYCDFGDAFAVYDPNSNIFWTEMDIEKLCTGVRYEH